MDKRELEEIQEDLRRRGFSERIIKDVKSMNETVERIKPTLDRLGKKETTDEDWKKLIKLIEDNLTRDFIKKLEDLPYRIWEMELNSGTKVMKLQVLYSDWFDLLTELKARVDG